MLFKGSGPRVLLRFRVQRGLHCTSHFCRIPPWLLKYESTSPATASASRANCSYRGNLEHPYRMIHSQRPHLDTTPVVQNVWSLANHQNEQKHGLWGNSQLPPAMKRSSVLAGESDSCQGGSSIASTIQGQNSTPSSLLNNSRVADITQCVTYSPSATQRWSINTPTAMPGTSAPRRTSQTDSMRRVVTSPASGIDSTPTPPSCLENLPTPIPNPEPRAIITNPLQMGATDRNQRQRQW